MEFPILLASGLAISVFGNLVGFGGGIFMVPLLVSGFHVPMHMAVGTVVLCLFPSAFLATLMNIRSRTVDYVVATSLEIPTIIGTLVGASLTAYLPVVTMEALFGTFVVILGLRLLLKKDETSNKLNLFIQWLNEIGPGIRHSKYQVEFRASFLSCGFFGLVAGSLAGMFGIGGGFLKMPVMLHVFKMPAKNAVATSLLMITVTSLTGSIAHFRLGHLDTKLGLPIFIGFMIGPFIARRLQKYMNEKWTESLVAYALILGGLVLLAEVFMPKV